jgi:hypothetical protein
MHSDSRMNPCEKFEWKQEYWLAARPLSYVVQEHERRLAALEAAVG